MVSDFSMPSAAEHSAQCTCVWRIKQVVLAPLLSSTNSATLSVHQALSLEQMTAEEFACKLSEKVGLKREQVSSVLQLTNTGILVIVDDTVGLVVLCPCYSCHGTGDQKLLC